MIILKEIPFQKENFRNRWGIKIYIVAICWSGVSLVLPLSETQVLGGFLFWLEWVQRFLLIVVWTLPFEIRDLEVDPPNLNTIPQKIGVKNTIFFGLFLLTLYLVLGLVFSNLVPYDIAMLLLTGGLLWKSRKKQSLYFSSFWVESIPILWLLLGLIYVFCPFYNFVF